MSRSSPSPHRQASVSSSHSSSLESTIWVEIIVYTWDHAYPSVKRIELPVFEAFFLCNSEWFKQLLPGDYRCELHLWHSLYNDWVTVSRHKVKIWVSRKSTTFILRFPHVRHCVDLGVELQYREDCRRTYYGLPPALAREVYDVRVPRPEKIGDNFIVVVYPARICVPLIFIIRLELDARIAIWDYPVLAQACFDGRSRTEAWAIHIGIRVWNPQRVQFDYCDADTSLYAVQGYDFILVRNEYNNYTPGLGDYIAKLEKQTLRPVEPTNILFDHQTHTPIVWPALSCRRPRELALDVDKGVEASDGSGSESECTDYDDDVRFLEYEMHTSSRSPSPDENVIRLNVGRPTGDWDLNL